jgi:hypothetical protein
MMLIRHTVIVGTALQALLAPALAASVTWRRIRRMEPDDPWPKVSIVIIFPHPDSLVYTNLNS